MKGCSVICDSSSVIAKSNAVTCDWSVESWLTGIGLGLAAIWMVVATGCGEGNAAVNSEAGSFDAAVGISVGNG